MKKFYSWILFLLAIHSVYYLTYQSELGDTKDDELVNGNTIITEEASIITSKDCYAKEDVDILVRYDLPSEQFMVDINLFNHFDDVRIAVTDEDEQVLCKEIMQPKYFQRTSCGFKTPKNLKDGGNFLDISIYRLTDDSRVFHDRHYYFHLVNSMTTNAGKPTTLQEKWHQVVAVMQDQHPLITGLSLIGLLLLWKLGTNKVEAVVAVDPSSDFSTHGGSPPPTNHFRGFFSMFHRPPPSSTTSSSPSITHQQQQLLLRRRSPFFYGEHVLTLLLTWTWQQPQRLLQNVRETLRLPAPILTTPVISTLPAPVLTAPSTQQDVKQARGQPLLSVAAEKPHAVVTKPYALPYLSTEKKDLTITVLTLAVLSPVRAFAQSVQHILAPAAIPTVKTGDSQQQPKNKGKEKENETKPILDLQPVQSSPISHILSSMWSAFTRPTASAVVTTASSKPTSESPKNSGYSNRKDKEMNHISQIHFPSWRRIVRNIFTGICLVVLCTRPESFAPQQITHVAVIHRHIQEWASQKTQRMQTLFTIWGQKLHSAMEPSMKAVPKPTKTSVSPPSTSTDIQQHISTSPKSPFRSFFAASTPSSSTSTVSSDMPTSRPPTTAVLSPRNKMDTATAAAKSTTPISRARRPTSPSPPSSPLVSANSHRAELQATMKPPVTLPSVLAMGQDALPLAMSDSRLYEEVDRRLHRQQASYRRKQFHNSKQYKNPLQVALDYDEASAADVYTAGIPSASKATHRVSSDSHLRDVYVYDRDYYEYYTTSSEYDGHQRDTHRTARLQDVSKPRHGHHLHVSWSSILWKRSLWLVAGEVIVQVWSRLFHSAEEDEDE